MKFVLALPVFALGCSAEPGTPPAHAESTPTRSEASSSAEPRSTDVQAPEATGSCAGQITEGLAAELRQRGEHSRVCYERALLEDKSLKGRMIVEATYAADGAQQEVKLATDAVGHPAMAACVLELFDARVHSAPSGGCVVIRIPLNFQPDPTATEAPEP